MCKDIGDMSEGKVFELGVCGQNAKEILFMAHGVHHIVKSVVKFCLVSIRKQLNSGPICRDDYCTFLQDALAVLPGIIFLLVTAMHA
jgi:hypothetical protein